MKVLILIGVVMLLLGLTHNQRVSQNAAMMLVVGGGVLAVAGARKQDGSF